MAPAESFWPAQIALLAEEAKEFSVADQDKAVIEIETDLYMPIFVYYFYGPEAFRGVTYPNLWSGNRQLSDWSGKYKIVYNISCLSQHYLRSIDSLNRADWLFLLYSRYHPECWDPSFKEVYDDKLRKSGRQDCLH